MTRRSLLRKAGGLALALVVVLLVLGHVLGQPILLSYVATGSMEPTMDAGDGFVAIPSALTGPPAQGDVIVFEAQVVNEGELTTHRVVGETDEGYVTRGDANPFTDQDGDEPHVTDGQVVAKALQVNGHVVTIPYLGSAVMGVQGVFETGYTSLSSVLGVPGDLDGEGLGAMMVAIGIALLGFGFAFDRVGPARRETSRTRERENVLAIWTAIGLVLLVFVTLATAAMVIPSGTTAYGVISTDDPSDDPQILAPGESSELTRTVQNDGYLPVVAVHESTSAGIAVDPASQTVWPRATGEATVTLTAPTTEGEYVRTVSEYRYLTFLPPTLLVWLHDVHPFVAVGAVNAVIVGITVAVVIGLFGGSDLRIRRPGSHVPLSRRLERKLREWW